MKFSIFTSCYNSALTIDRVFMSLNDQVFRDFEWVVFDDCSSDDTVTLIEAYIQENADIPVMFIKNTINKGLQSNYCEAIKLAKGEYLVQWDHDDIHKPNQLYLFNKILQQHSQNDISGVWALCEDQHGRLLGRRFPDYLTIGTYFTHYRKYITRYGNKMFYNERMPSVSLRKLREVEEYVRYNYPDEYSSLFPSFRWAFLAVLGYKTIYINEVVRTYFIEQGFVSLSNIRSSESSERIVLSNQVWINHFFKYFDIKHFMLKFGIYRSYTYHGIIVGQKLTSLIKRIAAIRGKFIVFFLYFPILTFRFLAKNIVKSILS